MKVLFINNWIHPKNLNSLQNYKNINFTTVGNISDIDEEKLKEFDAIYSPGKPIDVKKYMNSKFIFGPHLSIFPDNVETIEMMKGPNTIYVQPSEWTVDAWKTYRIADNLICNNLNMEVLPFGVDTDKFNNLNDVPRNNKTSVFLYIKYRNNHDINLIIDFLHKRNIHFKIFSYQQKYSETEYLEYLKQSKYGIWVGGHESQGFALQEALSCNIPLFVWSVESMNQTYDDNYNFDDIKATTIPYWDQRCGEYFHTPTELDSKFDLFLSKLDTYQPREYVVENLSFDACEMRLMNIIKKLSNEEE
jgi:hypothetical protein